MAMGDEVGRDTVADLNQFVHSWLDDASRRLDDLLEVLKTHEIVIRLEPRKSQNPPCK